MSEITFHSPKKGNTSVSVVSPDTVGTAVASTLSNVPDADAIKKMSAQEIADLLKKHQKEVEMELNFALLSTPGVKYVMF